MKLIVTQPFGSYAKGDEIADADKIATALETNPHAVVKVATADAAATPAAASVKSSV